MQSADSAYILTSILCAFNYCILKHVFEIVKFGFSLKRLADCLNNGFNLNVTMYTY